MYFKMAHNGGVGWGVTRVCKTEGWVPICRPMRSAKLISSLRTKGCTTCSGDVCSDDNIVVVAWGGTSVQEAVYREDEVTCSETLRSSDWLSRSGRRAKSQ